MTRGRPFGELPGGDELLELCRWADGVGHRFWVVGGAVRDLLLDRPLDEIDLVTDATLEEIGRRYPLHLVGRGGEFGTGVVVVDARVFEVSEMRAAPPPGSSVRDRLAADAGARDFTIDALYLEPDGGLLDFVGGLEDLRGGVIRGVGDPGARLAEDPLRILRGVRLAAQLGFRIDAGTAREMAARSASLADVAGERSAREVVKMASAGGESLAAGVELMRDNGALELLLPEVAALAGAEHRPEHHPEGDAYRHTLAALRSWPGRDPLTGLAILLHDIGKGKTGAGDAGGGRYHRHARVGAGMLPAIVSRLRLPSKWGAVLAYVADRHMLLHRLDELRPSTLRGLVGAEGWACLREVGLADVAARGDRGGEERMREALGKAEETARAAEERYRGVLRSAVSGRRVMELTGLDPGKRVGEIVDRVTAWALDNGVEDARLVEEAVGRIHRGEAC
jgi:tRNA nucleotidyltransferase/poly(A) polymerase